MLKSKILCSMEAAFSTNSASAFSDAFSLVAMTHYSDYFDFSFTNHSEVEEFLFHMSQILENWAP